VHLRLQLRAYLYSNMPKYGDNDSRGGSLRTFSMSAFNTKRAKKKTDITKLSKAGQLREFLSNWRIDIGKMIQAAERGGPQLDPLGDADSVGTKIWTSNMEEVRTYVLRPNQYTRSTIRRAISSAINILKLMHTEFVGTPDNPTTSISSLRGTGSSDTEESSDDEGGKCGGETDDDDDSCDDDDHIKPRGPTKVEKMLQNILINQQQTTANIAKLEGRVDTMARSAATAATSSSSAAPANVADNIQIFEMPAYDMTACDFGMRSNAKVCAQNN
jgi:hypothetical protein